MGGSGAARVWNVGLWSGLERAGACSSMKMRGSGVGSSVKLGSPELTCRTRLAGTLAGCNPGALAECFAFRLPTVNRLWAATERLEGKEILKMLVSRATKTLKWWCYLWKWYALERKFKAENGGLKNGTYPIWTYMEVPPPPPPGLHKDFSHIWTTEVKTAFTKFLLMTIFARVEIRPVNEFIVLMQMQTIHKWHLYHGC